MKNTLLVYGTEVPLNVWSEDLHKIEVEHFTTKRNPGRYAKKNSHEKHVLKNRMYKHPAKHGSPVGFPNR